MKPAFLACALVGAVLAAFGQVSLRQGADGRVFAADFLNGWIALGLGLYVAGTLLWIVALSAAPLTVVYPFAALTYVLVNVLAFALLGERLPLTGILGTALVLLGLLLVSMNLEASHAP